MLMAVESFLGTRRVFHVSYFLDMGACWICLINLRADRFVR